MMLTYKSTEFESRLKDCLKYLKGKEKGSGGLGVGFYDILADDFDVNEFDGIIDEKFSIFLSPDYSDIGKELSLYEFIDLIEETKSSKLIDNSICISNERCLFRVFSDDFETLSTLELLFDEKESLFPTFAKFENSKYEVSLINHITLFSIMVNFSDDFDKYLPSALQDDMFVQIKFEDKLELQKLKEIYNAYLFELKATLSIELKINPRPENFYDELDEESILKKNYELRPLMFGKGINDIIVLFNNAEIVYNNDYSILQYIKILEYVSQTVIRQSITARVQNKDLGNQYATDRSAIKAVIAECCDILSISKVAPSCLSKVLNLTENIKNPKANKQSLINSAIDSVANAISDTRDSIAHAKANYSCKGSECPEEHKGNFVNMLREISIQAIRWLDRVHEENRVSN